MKCHETTTKSLKIENMTKDKEESFTNKTKKSGPNLDLWGMPDVVQNVSPWWPILRKDFKKLVNILLYQPDLRF